MATVAAPNHDLLEVSMSRKGSRARVGAKLQKARERCGLSLRQIADSTKISLSVLQGLERDEIANLPGGVLGRGYLRSFASAVKLDPEAIVAEFVAQFPESSVKHGYPPAEQADADEAAEVRTSGNTTRINLNHSSHLARIASVVTLAIVLAGAMAFAAPEGWAKLDALRNWAMSAPADLVDAAVPAAREVTTLTARPIKMRRASGRLTLPPSRALPAATIEKARPGAPAATSGSDAASANPAPTDEPLKMTLSANSPSWVIASVDGRKTISRLMDVGEQETLEAARELVVTAGDGGAIVMTLNEAAGRTLGRPGKTATVRVNHANLQKLLGRDDPASVRLAQ